MGGGTPVQKEWKGKRLRGLEGLGWGWGGGGGGGSGSWDGDRGARVRLGGAVQGPLSLFLLLQYSWKLLHPTNEYDNKECPKDAEAYERVSGRSRNFSGGYLY